MVCALVGTEDLVSVAPELCAFDSAMRAHYLASTKNLCIRTSQMTFALVDSVDLVADAQALCFSCRPLNIMGNPVLLLGTLCFDHNKIKNMQVSIKLGSKIMICGHHLQ